jgi:hypothetical protein
MRPFAAAFLIVFAAGCHCSPTNPSSVTLRLKNNSNSAIFVDDTADKLGLTVQRNVSGTWYGFDETPACACQTCEQVCDLSCACDGGPPKFVRRVLPGTTFERTWNGIVQVQAISGCSNGGAENCLRPENGPLDEGFNLELCFQLQASGVGLPDGGRLAAQYPAAGQSCVDKEFRIADQVVEISPPKGSSCNVQGDCLGPMELCFSGSCTASCPDNGFPTLGAGWALRIAEPDDQGFFAVEDGGVVSGSGAITSVLYNAGTMTVRLRRTGPAGETYNGAVFVTLPAGAAVPLTQGAQVSVRVIDGSSATNPENRAVVIHDTDGGLLFAADQSQQGRLLSAADTAPFTLGNATPIVGCRTTECGKQLFFQTRFTAEGNDTLLDPGKSATVTLSSGAYQVLNVSNASYAITTCKLSDIRPYALWRQSP